MLSIQTNHYLDKLNAPPCAEKSSLEAGFAETGQLPTIQT
jgi:hypothetical protein